MNLLEAGDAILDVVGPLGKPSDIEHYGTAVVIGGSVGTAIALPVARALKQAGNHVIGITGSRSKDLLILENELRAATDETFVMMRAVAEVTKGRDIKTVVSLNSIMVDGTGMCGGCRVLVGAKNEFACVDGPEFDAHRVNFEVLMQRNNMYRDKEQLSLNEFLANPQAELSRVREACRLRELEEKAATEATHV